MALIAWQERLTRCPRCDRWGKATNGARFGFTEPICARCWRTLYRRERRAAARVAAIADPDVPLDPVLQERLNHDARLSGGDPLATDGHRVN